MSKRRCAGEWVWLRPNAGFVGESNRLKAEIMPEDVDKNAPYPCVLECGDDDCREWVMLHTEPDTKTDGKRHVLCHISECEMFDEPQR
jgi:hypothetical protein